MAAPAARCPCSSWASACAAARSEADGRRSFCFTAVLSTPSLLLANSFRKDVSLNAKGGDPGNLIQPLSLLQSLGIWPVGDFRLRPPDMSITYVLLAVLVAARSRRLYWAVRRRAWEVPSTSRRAAVGCALAVRVGSSWVGGKALAIASPASC